MNQFARSLINAAYCQLLIVIHRSLATPARWALCKRFSHRIYLMHRDSPSPLIRTVVDGLDSLCDGAECEAWRSASSWLGGDEYDEEYELTLNNEIRKMRESGIGEYPLGFDATFTFDDLQDFRILAREDPARFTTPRMRNGDDIPF